MAFADLMRKIGKWGEDFAESMVFGAKSAASSAASGLLFVGTARDRAASSGARKAELVAGGLPGSFGTISADFGPSNSGSPTGKTSEWNPANSGHRPPFNTPSVGPQYSTSTDHSVFTQAPIVVSAAEQAPADNKQIQVIKYPEATYYDNGVSIAVIPSSSLLKSKTAQMQRIRERLGNLVQQKQADESAPLWTQNDPVVIEADAKLKESLAHSMSQRRGIVADTVLSQFGFNASDQTAPYTDFTPDLSSMQLR